MSCKFLMRTFNAFGQVPFKSLQATACGAPSSDVLGWFMSLLQTSTASPSVPEFFRWVYQRV